jgi:hypothetical protein
LSAGPADGTAARHTAETTIGRSILHCSRRITGCWRSDTLGVQILPPPAQAPQPPVIMADHPFILETRIESDSDGFVINRRRLTAMMESGLVLNAVLRMQVIVPDPRGRHAWVWDDEANRGRWLQLSYFVPDFEIQAPKLTDSECEPIPLYLHGEYYESDIPPGAETDSAALPDSLEDLLLAFAELTPEDRTSYLRAAAWVHFAQQVWDLSQSAWFTALVSAIETLAPKIQERCPMCGSMVGVSKNVRDFVERYSPRSDPKMRSTIYTVRSKISHGSMLFSIDAKPWAFGETWNVKEQDAQDSLYRIVRDIMVNWLLDQPHTTKGSS